MFKFFDSLTNRIRRLINVLLQRRDSKMAKLLFALENEMEGYEEGEMMETTPEEGEIADTEMEMIPEEGEIMETSEAISEGSDAADQLEEVEEVMEHSMEEGEGMDPVAAECLRIAVEAIAVRVGYDSKSMKSLYATENFSSTSSRKANTAIALEGIGEFLKSLWEKIKAAVKSIWDKVVAFWNKHLSSLGRAKSALESMKLKIGKVGSKSPKESTVEKAPGSLINLFASSGDINESIIEKYIKAHASQLSAIKKYDGINKSITLFTSNSGKINSVKSSEDLDKFKEERIKELDDNSETKHENNSNKRYFIGGIHTYTTIIDGKYKHNTEEMEDKKTDPSISISDKEKLKKFINDTLSVIDATIKFKEQITKLNKDVTKAIIDVEREINDTKNKPNKVGRKQADEGGSNADQYWKDANKFNLSMFRSQITFKAVEFTKVLSLNVKLAGAVIKYTAFSISNYTDK